MFYLNTTDLCHYLFILFLIYNLSPLFVLLC